MFEWKNLPDTIDPRYVELILFELGSCAFFNDIAMGDMVLPFTYQGIIDHQHNPTEIRVYSSNGRYSAPKINNVDAICIWDNFLRETKHNAICIFTDRIWNISMAIDTNVNAQKTPILVLCDETQKLSLKNIYAQYEGNEPVIFGYNGLDPNSLQVLKTDAPVVFDKLADLKNYYFSEALTYLGVNNNLIDKKERVLQAEVDSNNDFILLNRNTSLIMRQQAAEKINQLFGTNIEVEERELFNITDSIRMPAGQLHLDGTMDDAHGSGKE